MIKFKNHKKETLLALADVTFKHTVNGEKSFSGTIYTNDDVLNKIDRGWSLEFNNEVYYITYAKPNDLGNGITVEFDAVHEFFYRMGKTSVYEQLPDGSHTAQVYLDFIFKGSEYSYQLGVDIPAFEKQSFGMDTRLSLFNNFINQTKTEFSVSGKTVSIVEKTEATYRQLFEKDLTYKRLG